MGLNGECCCADGDARRLVGRGSEVLECSLTSLFPVTKLRRCESYAMGQRWQAGRRWAAS